MAARVAVRQWSARLIIRAKSISWLGGRTNDGAAAGSASAGPRRLPVGGLGEVVVVRLGLARHDAHLAVVERKDEGSFEPLGCLEPVRYGVGGASLGACVRT